MIGDVELLVLIGRVGIILLLYLFASIVLLVVWRGTGAGEAPADALAGAARLVLLDPAGSGLQVGTEFTLASSGTIGRGAPNTVVLPDAAVSARHARITFRHGGWWVEDLQSANGTSVNGTPATGPIPLGDDDELEVAQIRLRMEIG